MKTQEVCIPSFDKSVTKFVARELHIGYLYPLLTGNYLLPSDKGYWYLCNLQTKKEGSEIHQLTTLLRSRGGRDQGYVFATPEQCYGVDRSRNIIKKNKKNHPKSNWIAAEWNDAIQDQSMFRPGLVYLDTTSFADKMPAVNALSETLKMCDKDTLVIANVMISNARAGLGDRLLDDEALIENLLAEQHPETFAAWNVSPEDPTQNVFHSYEYKTRKAHMRSYVFFKGTLPTEARMAEEFARFNDWCLTQVQGI